MSMSVSSMERAFLFVVEGRINVGQISIGMRQLWGYV